METDKKNTHVGIIILGILALLFGLIQVRRGLDLAIYPLYPGSLGLIFGIILIITGIIAGIFGVGCFLAWSWTWFIGVIFSGAGIIFLLVASLGIVSTAPLAMDFINIVEIVVAGIIFWYLFQPHVKAHFGKT